MKKIIKSSLVIFLLIVLFTTPYLTLAVSSTACNFLKNIQASLFPVAGTLIVISWIIAGIIYLTSIGKQEQMTLGKKAIVAAITGTVLISLAGAMYDVIAALLGYTAMGSICK